MLLTEEESRQKWCPHSRSSSYHNTGAAINRRSGGAEPNCNCVASECMAWRWKWMVSSERLYPEQTEHGFCGLAGKVGE